MTNIQDTSYSKMSQEFSAHQTAKTFAQSSKRSAQLKKQMYIFLDLRKNGTTQEKSWVTVTPSLGEPWIRNTSVCHSEGQDVFLVGDFRGTSANKILFESEGLSGYSSESCHSWKESTAAVEKGTRTASGENGSAVVLCDQGENRIDVYDNMTATLRSQAHHPPIIMESAGFCTEHFAKRRIRIVRSIRFGAMVYANGVLCLFYRVSHISIKMKMTTSLDFKTQQQPIHNDLYRLLL